MGKKNKKFRLKNVDFCFHPDFEGHGAYGDREILINPARHECLEDLYSTWQHEMIHFCLDKFDEDQVHSHKEEWIIKMISWTYQGEMLL